MPVAVYSASLMPARRASSCAAAPGVVVAGADLILELAEMARCALAAFEGGEQALLEDLAHPGDRLLGAARASAPDLVSAA